MEPNPILDEIHKIRQQLAAQLGNDTHAIGEWARRRQGEMGHEVVSYPSRRPHAVEPEEEESTAAERTQGDLLAALARLRRIHPEWQFGKIVVKVAREAGRTTPSGLWDLEDDDALAAARKLIRRDSEGGSDAA